MTFSLRILSGVYNVWRSVSLMSKRSRDGDVLVCLKRGRFENRDHFEPEEISLKRSAPFDMEMQRMQKRMRATVPTAEEAMAFLIPHLLEFRRLYFESEQRAKNLECQIQTLSRSYECLARSSEQKTRLLGRQLDIARYRLSVLGSKPSVVLGPSGV